MGQKTNPICNRLGIIKGWQANWFASKKDFAQRLHADTIIRDYLHSQVPRIIAKILIERVSDAVTITIQTPRPGTVIGAGGKKIQGLKAGIQKRINKNVHVKISEIKIPELNACLVANEIARQIEIGISYKRAAARPLDNATYLGAQGVQVELAGRLGGVEKSRKIRLTKGSIPRQTFRADIDYAYTTAKTTYGIIGVKVWIFTQQVYGKRDLSLNIETPKRAAK